MHLFRSEHLETVCPSCRTPHKKEWFSEWWRHEHYKKFVCGCGYKIFIRTEESHSGHWHDEESEPQNVEIRN